MAEKFKTVGAFWNGYSIMTKEEVHKAMIEYCKYQIDQILDNSSMIYIRKDKGNSIFGLDTAVYDYDTFEKFKNNLK